MATIIIKDPYEGNYEVQIDDSTPKEAVDELIAFMDGNRKQIQSLERKERRHQPFSVDNLIYEGIDYASKDTPETVLFREDDDDKIERYLSVLTETQKRRCRMRLAGLTYQKIAEIEGADYSSVAESVKAAGKKLHKNFPNIF